MCEGILELSCYAFSIECIVSCRGLAVDKPDQVHAIVDSLQSSLSSVYEGHRIAVVAFYSEVSRNFSNVS